MTQLMLLLASGKPKPPKAPDLVKPVAHGLEQTLIKFWPLWLLLLLVALGKVAWGAYQMRRLSKSGITEIDRMSGHTFEEFLSTLFRRLGYHVELTSRHGDYGADLVVTKGKKRTAVQAKRWNKRVGVKAVQEAVASKGMYGCDAALVVANQEFTQQAQKLARANEVELWGRGVLVERLLSVRGKQAPVEQLALEHTGETAPVAVPAETIAITASTTAVESPTETITAAATCVTCGVTVSEKVRDYCEQHSERFGGRIYCFKHQRSVGAVPATD
ncbi:MAG TPA: restriction endonuclease [Gaiellaceae bacterium]